MSNFDDDSKELKRIEEQNRSLQESHGDPKPGDDLQANDDLSMASSVTRHTQISQQAAEPQILEELSSGIDTLDIGLFVEFDNSYSAQLESRLDIGKSNAQNGNPYRDPFCNMLHMPKGKKGYRWHLKTFDYDVYISRGLEPLKSTPNVYVSCSSHKLWTSGIEGTLNDLESFIGQLNGTVTEVKISRVDLAADFKLDKNLDEDFINKYRVPIDAENKFFRTGNDLESFYQGNPNNEIQIRIYNKSAEISHSNKLWFYDVWKTTPSDSIWRIEFQLRRPLLKKNSINTPQQLA